MDVIIIQEFKKHLAILCSSTNLQDTPSAPPRNRTLKKGNAAGVDLKKPNGLLRTICVSFLFRQILINYLVFFVRIHVTRIGTCATTAVCFTELLSIKIVQSIALFLSEIINCICYISASQSYYILQLYQYLNKKATKLYTHFYFYNFVISKNYCMLDYNVTRMKFTWHLSVIYSQHSQ